MSTRAAERRLAAIMFTDIVDYTALMAESEEKGLAARERHRALVRPLVEEYHGESIEARGDESLSTFPTALDAVNCALAIGEALADDDELKLHVGIHLGDFVVRGGEISGDGVNIAARICALSDGDAPCISDEVERSVHNQTNLSFEALGEQQLKNVPRPVPVFRVSGTTQPPRRLLPVWSRLQRRPGAWVASTVLLLLSTGLCWGYRPVATQGPIRSLAVLPLENLSGDPEQEYFADGMTEALIGDLAKISALRVISRTSVMHYKGERRPLPEIAQELGVDWVIEGTVMREADRVRITTQLIDARSDVHIWSERYDRDLSDVLALQADVARAVAREIKVAVTPTEESRLTNTRRVDPETYEAYLRGMYYLNKSTPEEFQQGLAYLHEAVEKNPGDPLAYAGLALGYATLGHGPAPPLDAWPKAQAAALRALKLDDTLAEAHLALGDAKLYYEWDWAGAEQSLRRALELDPSLAMAHYHYAWHHALFGRLDEAIVEHKRAQELDPLTPLYTAWLGGLYWYGGQYEEAIAEAEKSLQLDPGFGQGLFVLGAAYAESGMYAEAIAAHQAAAAANPAWRFGLGRSYAMAGRTDEARQILADLSGEEPTPWGAWGLAVLNTALGEKNEAFRWLAY
ncbi:MAG: tetratricopeptide repeat protein [Myxococcota bacterium]